MFDKPLRRALGAAVATLAFAVARPPSPARAIVYHGAPDLVLTARLVGAGSAGGTFHAQTLFARAFGRAWPAEKARMQTKYGAAALRTTFVVMDYTVADALRIVTRDKVPVPAPAAGGTPLPEALWRAGAAPNGRYDVGYMLERMVTHRYHHEIMRDLDAKFGHANNATFHIVLATLVEDGHSGR